MGETSVCGCVAGAPHWGLHPNNSMTSNAERCTSWPPATNQMA